MLNGGFGYYRNQDGHLVKKPSSYGKTIGNNVEIGQNTVIDDGSYRDTTVGDGTKIDNLCHIGHNTIIGRHCLIVAGCVLGGSSTLGDFSYIGMNSSIKDHVNIGKHCIVGAGSVVTKDVPDYDIIAGCPAKSILDKVTLTKKERFNMAYVQE